MIGVLGSSGFLGTNLCSKLRKLGYDYVKGSKSLDGRFNVDARNHLSIDNWIKRNGITKIINLAAICGGIGLNKKNPFQLWKATTLITSSVLDSAITMKIEKVVMLGSVCSYAAECPVPFKEIDLMNHGFPEPTNRAYGVSKLNGLIGAAAAFQEYDLDVTNLVPVNMYGLHDHFDLENSHVIPALIRKMVEAKNDGLDEVVVWGSGRASREFLYAEDCCDAIIKSLDKFTGPDMINIGSGSEITIKDLVIKIKDKVGYEGNIIWDDSKPDGQIRRCLNISRAEKFLGWKPSTNLDDGLEKTIKWYLESI